MTIGDTVYYGRLKGEVIEATPRSVKVKWAPGWCGVYRRNLLVREVKVVEVNNG